MIDELTPSAQELPDIVAPTPKARAKTRHRLKATPEVSPSLWRQRQQARQIVATGTGAVAVVLWLGLINMPRGGSPN